MNYIKQVIKEVGEYYFLLFLVPIGLVAASMTFGWMGSSIPMWNWPYLAELHAHQEWVSAIFGR